jgi:hypothetical protein
MEGNGGGVGWGIKEEFHGGGKGRLHMLGKDDVMTMGVIF